MALNTMTIIKMMLIRMSLIRMILSNAALNSVKLSRTTLSIMAHFRKHSAILSRLHEAILSIMTE